MEVGGKSCSGYPYVCVPLYPLWETRSVFGGEGKPTAPILLTLSVFKILENPDYILPYPAFSGLFHLFWVSKSVGAIFP